MKKFLMISLAACVCFCLGTPVMGEVKIGGMICLDTYFSKADKDYMAISQYSHGKSSVTQIQMENTAGTNVNIKWTEGKFGMYWEHTMGSDDIQSVTQEIPLESGMGRMINPAENNWFRYLYGWWDITPDIKLTAGLGGTEFSKLSPMQMLGMGSGEFRILGEGFGNLFDSYQYMVRGNFKLREGASVGIALSSPYGASLAHGMYWTKSGYPEVPRGVRNAIEDSAANMGIPFGPALSPQKLGLSQVVPLGDHEFRLPRIDLTGEFELGPLTLYPSFLYQKQVWSSVRRDPYFDKEYPDYTPPGPDDEIETWLAALGVKLAVGNFGIDAEINYGQNPGNTNLLVMGVYWNYGHSDLMHALGARTIPEFPLGGPGIDTAAIVDPDGQVCDTDYLGYWIDFSYKLPYYQSLHAIFSRQVIENDMGHIGGVNRPDRENTRTMYTFNWWVPLSRHMMLTPEVTIFDYGDREVQGSPDVDLGRYIVYGLNWKFFF